MIYVIRVFGKAKLSILWKIRNRWLNALKLPKKLNMRVSHIFKESNMVADKLANHSYSVHKHSLWFSPLYFIEDLISRDIVHSLITVLYEFLEDLGTIFSLIDFSIRFSIKVFNEARLCDVLAICEFRLYSMEGVRV